VKSGKPEEFDVSKAYQPRGYVSTKLACGSIVGLVLACGTVASAWQEAPKEQPKEAPAKEAPAKDAAPKPTPPIRISPNDPSNRPATIMRPGLGQPAVVRPAVAPKQPVAPGAVAPGTAVPVPNPNPAGKPMQPGAGELGGAGGDKGNEGNGVDAAEEAAALGAGFPEAAPQDGAVVDGDRSGDESVTLAAFSEPVQLSALVSLLATTLNINVSIIGDLQGTVAFNAAVPVKKSELLRLVDSLLGQSGWTITQDPATGWYLVLQEGEVPLNFGGDFANTRVFSTPNIRPSTVVSAMQTQLSGGGGGTSGQPAGQGGRMQAFDDLGIIIVTDSIRKLAQIESLLNRIMLEHSKARFIRVSLNHLAAPAARDRILQLLGQAPQSRGNMDPNMAIQMQNRAAQPNMGGAGGGGTVGSLDSIGDRLTVDPASNALIFRGMPEEIEQVNSLLAVIDVPNSLVPRRFFAGANATQIASLAASRGLGEVTSIGQGRSDQGGNGLGGQNGFQQNLINRQTNPGGMGGMNSGELSMDVGGPMMLVDEANGNIIYYGTPTQHEQLDKLIEQLDIQSERIVIREYRLKNSKAEDVADVVMGLLNNESPTGESALLPDGGTGMGGDGNSRSRFSSFGDSNRPDRNDNNSRNRRNQRSTNQNNQNGQSNDPTFPGAPGSGEEGGLELDGTNAFVIADVKNNQLLVKAPAARQDDFRKLIEKLDLRRPQVYLEVQIMAVTWSDDLRLAFETQLLNANGTGGALQTNFGLTTAGTGFTDRRNVATGLSGLTAAIIKSDQLPIVINALQTKSDTRILSNPALLVDDNEEAEIMSVEQQPYSTTQVTTGAPNTTSFGGYESAGTKLAITPSISDDGYLRLNYEAELSSFTASVGSNGSPPPKLENTVKAASITVPSDTTVIVGGLNVDTRRKTRIQVPLLGDIPLIGHLFQDYSRSGRTTTLYVFITPRIMREPNFADMRLLTEGPQKKSAIARDYPALKPTAIEINGLPLVTWPDTTKPGESRNNNLSPASMMTREVDLSKPGPGLDAPAANPSDADTTGAEVPAAETQPAESPKSPA